MTGEVVIKRAWGLVTDTAPNKRNPVKEMVAHLNDGVRDLLARRPFLRLDDAGGLVDGFADLTTDDYKTEALPVDEDYREGLAHYIAYRVFELDGADEHNTLMYRHHFKKYKEMT